MGKCVGRMGHECGSRQGLQLFEQDDGFIDGYCFSCNTKVVNPLGQPAKVEDIPEELRTMQLSEEDIKAQWAEIEECESVTLVERKLRKSVLEDFDVRIGFDRATGKIPEVAYFKYTEDGKVVRWKCKVFEGKKFFNIGTSNNVDLFGWEQALKTGAKRLLITEGEFDAVALKRIIDMYTNEKFEDFKPAVCSLPNGAASAVRDLTRLMPKIRRSFKEIVLVFDSDKAGRKAVEDVCKQFQGVVSVELPAKDANDCLIRGVDKAAFKAVTFNIEKPKNTRIVYGEDLHESARKPAEFGQLTWPWKGINDATRGIRYGETIYIGAGVKMGKSEILNALGAHFVQNHGEKIFLAKPEEANNKTYKLLAGKVTGSVFHDPTIPFDFQKYDQAGEILRGKVGMVNLYQHLGWSSLQEDMYAAAEWGAKALFIDPITNLTNGVAAADANTQLQGVAQDLAAMAKDLDVVVFIFCHLKAPLVGPDHEHGGHVLSSQFAGSRAMMRSCNYMIGLEGNKDPELPEMDRNLRKLVLLEDREFGTTGTWGLSWDRPTGMFSEVNLNDR